MNGVIRQVRLCGEGFQSVSLWAVAMGIDKGKGISHLFKGHRPIPLTSPMPRSESRSVRSKLARTLELSGRYLQEVFSYGSEVRLAYIVLAIRAAGLHTLRREGSLGTVAWDESDAFLRPLRDTLTHVNRPLDPMWDFGPWAEGYFSRITTFPLTSDGFGEG